MTKRGKGGSEAGYDEGADHHGRYQSIALLDDCAGLLRCDGGSEPEGQQGEAGIHDLVFRCRILRGRVERRKKKVSSPRGRGEGDV